AAAHPPPLLTLRPGSAPAGSVPASVPHISPQPCDPGIDAWAPGLVTTVRRLSPAIVLCMGRMANCRGSQLPRALPDTAVIGTLRTGRTLPWLFRRSPRRVRHVVANTNEAAALGLVHTSLLSVIYNECQ